MTVNRHLEKPKNKIIKTKKQNTIRNIHTDKPKIIKPKIKKKPLSPAQKKRDASIMKAEDRRRPMSPNITMHNPSGGKPAHVVGRKYYSGKKGFKGTAYGANKGSKTYREKLADKKAADNKDAKRGGFLSANAMLLSSKKSNKKVADNKKRREDKIKSRGRK
jgi:hypothetical protein|tara:strand:+ start:62 stop:547 length:486 start_codon:yes stop_codon:yes gene_type:complete